MLDLLTAALLAAAAAAPAPDSARAGRVVREFRPVEVTGTRLADMGAVQSVRTLEGAALRRLPLDRYSDAVALLPGVVATGEELHVRGGRAGELAVTLGGVPLNDPQFGGAPELPLFAVRASDLMTGPLDADRAGSLAGELDVQTETPTAEPHLRARWLSDGRQYGGYDAAHLGFSGPLRRTGIGVAAAAEARLDDQGMPDLRGLARTSVLGGSFGWRADNHLLGWLKVAPVDRPQRASVELLGTRVVRAPYDPMFTYDGWVTYHEVQPTDPPGTPFIILTPKPFDASSFYYRAADHVVMTDERRLALVGQATSGMRVPLHLAGGWQHTTALTSVGLRRDTDNLTVDNLPVFGPYDQNGIDPFHAYAGDEPYYRYARADRLFARADASASPWRFHSLRAGAGLQWDRLTYTELDIASPRTPNVDSLRTYVAGAPGGFAYVQHRWTAGGLILSDGLRLQAFTAGPDAPGAHAHWTLSPRLGIAYPVSVQDAFSFAYARIEQDPARDFLYESRTRGYDRLPLGNGTIGPSEAVLWQAALKHVLDPQWTFQISVFMRDVFGEPGARNVAEPFGASQLQYEGADDAHANGVEFDVTRTYPGGGRVHAAYTFTNAWGTASNPEGIAYGSAFGDRPLPNGDHPLDWSIQHALVLDGQARARAGFTVAWATHVATGRPWTPLYRDNPYTSDWPPLYLDQSLVNSQRLPWSEQTDVDVRWTHRRLRGATLVLAVSNLFDHRGDLLADISGYPNPIINTLYDEYAAYRTETGNGGGAYWNGNGSSQRDWQPVNDPRLAQRPRTIRLGISFGD